MSLIPTNLHKVHKYKSVRIQVHFNWKAPRCASDALCADSEQVKGAGLSEDCVCGLSIKRIPASETNSNRLWCRKPMFEYSSRCLFGIKFLFFYKTKLLIRGKICESYWAHILKTWEHRNDYVNVTVRQFYISLACVFTYFRIVSVYYTLELTEMLTLMFW